MILLDTNILSELMQQTPDSHVVRWLDRQPRTSIWTTSITIFEIRFGLEWMAIGRRKVLITSAFEILLDRIIQQRIAPFDAAAANHAAALSAARRTFGRPGELRDTMIAGIALASHATIATRNRKHFNDISTPVVNPFDQTSQSPDVVAC